MSDATAKAQPSSRRWLKRLSLALLILLSGLLLTTVSAYFWLTRTTSGAGFALSQAQGALEALNWSSLSGNLHDGLIVSELELRQAGSATRVTQAELAARIQLLGGLELTIERLLLRDVDLQLPPATPATESETLDALPEMASPIPLIIESLRIEQLRIARAPADAPLLLVHSLALAGRVHEVADLEHFEITMPEAQVSVTGQAGLNAPHRLDLAVSANTRLDTLPDHQIDLQLAGPLADLAIDLQSAGPASLQGLLRLQGLPALDELELALDGQIVDWPELDLDVQDLALNISGPPEAWTARLVGRVTGEGIPANAIQVEATGDLDSARLGSMTIDTLDGRIQAQGEVAWNPAQRASLAVILEQLDFTPLYPDLPAQARLNGRLDLALADDLIVLETLSLQAPPTRLSVSGSGRYDPSGDALALDLAWQDFTWPPVSNGEAAIVASEAGTLTLSGRLSDWQAELEALLQAPDQPGADVEASVRGSRSGAQIEALTLDASSLGRVRVTGEVSWQPELQGQLAVMLQDLDPSEFVRQLPGRINGQVDLLINDPDDVQFAINELSGTLRGQALSGGGRLHWRTDAPQQGQLTLGLGNNRLDIDSNDGDRWAFTLQGRALDQLWPGLSGVLQAQGFLLPASGEVNATAQLRDSGLNDVTLRAMDLTADLRWLEPTRADVVLSLEDLDLNPWERIDALELTLNGHCSAHDFALNFGAQRASLDLQGAGQWPDCFRGGTQWDGAIDRLFLGDTLAGDWQLSEPLPVRIESDGATLQSACLATAGPTAGAVCLEQARLAPAGQSSNARVRLTEVPLDLVLLPLDLTVSLNSPLSGELDTAWTAAAGLDRLAGFLELGQGQITPLGSDQPLLGIDRFRLDLTPAERGVLAELDGQLEGDSSLTGSIDIADLRQPGQSAVDGRLRLDLPDISVFNRAVTELDEMHGQLAGNLTVQGTLAEPDIRGDARLSNGRLRHAPLGLTIEGMELGLSGSHEGAALRGEMRSGEGQLRLDGTLTPQGDQWAWTLHSEGERFSLADAPWLKLAISPDVELNGVGERMTIDGDVGIDRLEAGLPPGRAAQISASEDIVVLGEVEPEAVQSPLVMTGRLGIDLGDNARLDAAGLETDLAGEVELLWNEDEALPRSRGIIRLPEGTFEAYGQNLEIENGEIVLSNQPITDPRLNIDAVREIFGDPAVQQAGVSIRGNAQAPVIQLFTDPPTSEEKALAYVLTGADFDHAGGQGAVNVGLYLLPKLFVSYGIGLFESGNVLSGRYELSRRWGVRVVSGERDTGVDLSYAVDR